MRLFVWICIISLTQIFAEQFYYGTKNKKISLTPIQTSQPQTQNGKKIQYFQTNTGVSVGISDEIMIMIQDKSRLLELQKIYHFSIKESLDEITFVITANNTDTINLANTLHTQSGVILSHPNFIRTLQLK